jgi:hypothetical protein
MFAFMLSLWREWKTDHLFKATLISALCLCAVGAFFSFNPLALTQCLLFLSLGLGWRAGSRFEADSTARRLLLSARLSPLGGTVGTLCSTVLVALAQFAIALPCVAIMVIVWGLPLSCLSACLTICLSSYLLASALGCLFSLCFSNAEGFLGALCILMWLTVTSLFTPLRLGNPVLQTWLAVKDAELGRAWLCAAVLLGVSAAVYVGIGLILRTKGREGADDE